MKSIKKVFRGCGYDLFTCIRIIIFNKYKMYIFNGIVFFLFFTRFNEMFKPFNGIINFFFVFSFRHCTS